MRTPLALTFRRHADWPECLRVVGLALVRFDWVRVPCGCHYVRAQVMGPAVGYAGSVRSFAFGMGTPVLMQEPALPAGLGALVMPLRTHPADWSLLELEKTV
jgi:hypothetical protein